MFLPNRLQKIIGFGRAKQLEVLPVLSARPLAWRCRPMKSGTAFLAVASKVGAGCVITDVRMPELSGVDLPRRLRNSSLAFR